MKEMHISNKAISISSTNVDVLIQANKGKEESMNKLMIILIVSTAYPLLSSGGQELTSAISSEMVIAFKDKANNLFNENSGKYLASEEDTTNIVTDSLSGHKRKHIEEELHKCDQCGYSAPCPSALIIHKRKHTGEKPYKCDQCYFSTAYSGNLITHKHSHTGEKLLKCDQCDYTSAHSSDLKIHKRIHTGEKPYQCNQCEKAFTTSGNLNNHKRIHTGEKPYICDYPECNKAFSQAGNLKIHKRIHTPGWPYRCDQCGEDFTAFRSLDIHKKRDHNKAVNVAKINEDEAMDAEVLKVQVMRLGH
jgi:hypothetical protein